MFGVHQIYDFVAFLCPGQPAVSTCLTIVPDLATADLDPGILHSDLALLPITPMH
jgi:hypothetical protein